MDAKMVGTRIDFPDYRSHVTTVAAILDAAAQIADPAFTRTVVQAGQDFLLPPLEVTFSERTGDDPHVPEKRLGMSILAGCRALPGPMTKALLEKIALREDVGVCAEAKTLLASYR
jgi:hypothetical protein